MAQIHKVSRDIPLKKNTANGFIALMISVVLFSSIIYSRKNQFKYVNG